MRCIDFYFYLLTIYDCNYGNVLEAVSEHKRGEKREEGETTLIRAASSFSSYSFICYLKGRNDYTGNRIYSV